MTLPTLYTLKQICEASQYSTKTVMRALKRCPDIRTVGRGRGIRLTEIDYQMLIEAFNSCAVTGRFLTGSGGIC